jgi:hypothetical protein
MAIVFRYIVEVFLNICNYSRAVFSVGNGKSWFVLLLNAEQMQSRCADQS